MKKLMNNKLDNKNINLEKSNIFTNKLNTKYNSVKLNTKVENVGEIKHFQPSHKE
jgi:hypothetical protein